jgi:hypothetical protein
VRWLVGLAIILLLTVAQESFYELHRRRYGLWRSSRQRRLWADTNERRRMWTAITHRDPDPTVERGRLIALAIILLSFVALFALIRPDPAG